MGEITVAVNKPENSFPAAVYNLVPPPGSPARLGFVVLGVPLVIDGAVKESPDYNIVGRLRNVKQTLKVFASELKLFGAIGDKAFLTLPTNCAEPLASSYEVSSWEGAVDSGSVLTHDGAGNPQAFSGCDRLPFDPQVSSQAQHRFGLLGLGP